MVLSNSNGINTKIFKSCLTLAKWSCVTFYGVKNLLLSKSSKSQTDGHKDYYKLKSQS